MQLFKSAAAIFGYICMPPINKGALNTQIAQKYAEQVRVLYVYAIFPPPHPTPEPVRSWCKNVCFKSRPIQTTTLSRDLIVAVLSRVTNSTSSSSVGSLYNCFNRVYNRSKLQLPSPPPKKRRTILKYFFSWILKSFSKVFTLQSVTEKWHNHVPKYIPLAYLQARSEVNRIEN